jgi:hypothetical protein
MAGQLTIDTLKASSGVLATQNGMTGIAKAWVLFAGASGTITNSFNVSSVTRGGTGSYTVNFTTAMANANYCSVASAGNGSGAAVANTDLPISTPTTSTLTLATTNNSNAQADFAYTQVVVFGN